MGKLFLFVQLLKALATFAGARPHARTFALRLGALDAIGPCAVGDAWDLAAGERFVWGRTVCEADRALSQVLWAEEVAFIVGEWRPPPEVPWAVLNGSW